MKFVLPKSLTRNSEFSKTFPNQLILKRIKIAARGNSFFSCQKSKIIFIGYHEAFVEIFKKHLDHEFEVQMREGSITVEGMAVVEELVSEHSVCKLMRIFLEL